MSYQEIRNLCKKGEIGMIPGWKGTLNGTMDWKNYSLLMEIM